MSRAGGKSGGGKRTITSDEAELWDHATRTLAPVKAKARVSEAAPAPAESPPRPLPPPVKSKPAPPVAKPREPAQARPTPPLADFDRRKARQIASGKVEIEARIDLHGMRQRDAAAGLRAFLLDAHARGLKTVLVITGKGGEAQRGDYMTEQMGGEPRRGVLRRSVPQWLDQPDLRAVVLGYTNAGVRHGGEGALYVQLRKPVRREHSEN